MPDEFRFQRTARELLQRARGQGRRVRVFSGMVAVLWAQGNCDAAIRLEHCWTRLQAAEQFPLFCAYPRAQFKTDAEATIQTVCSAHSRVIPGYV
jgi:hypothetical protein